MTKRDEIEELGAFLEGIDPGAPSNDQAVSVTLDFLIGKHTPDGLAEAVLPRVRDLRGLRGELILGVIEGLARDDLWDALADAIVAQPDLAPDRAWMALEVLEGTGRIEERPALMELREEIEELLAEDVVLSDLAREIEADPLTIPAALDALNRIELDIRLKIIAGLGCEPPSRSLIALLQGLADGGDEAARDVSAEALKSVRSRHSSGEVEAANREIATAHPPPLLMASVIGPLDGEGRGAIALVAARAEGAVVVRFDCGVLDGLVAASLEGPYPHDEAISRWSEIAQSLGPEAARGCPISAWLLLTGAAWLSVDTIREDARAALVATFGDGFAARPIFAPGESSRRNAESDSDIRSDVRAVLERRPFWVDESDLTRRLSDEMMIRDGNVSPDPTRDPGPFRVLFEGRILGRIELYRRVLLWSAMVWQESGQSDLSVAAKRIAEGLSDPQNAVPGYPFVEELMIRSLCNARSREPLSVPK